MKQRVGEDGIEDKRRKVRANGANESAAGRVVQNQQKPTVNR